MALTLSNAARSAGLNSILDLLDVGGAGNLVLQNAANATIVTNVLSATGFADAINGVATGNAITDGTAILGDTVAKAKLTNNAGTTVISELTVGVIGSGEDVELSSLTFAVNDKCEIDSATITMPAS